MLNFSTISPGDLLSVQDRLRDDLRHCGTVEAAAQATVAALHRDFSHGVVLARMFATLPFGGLPEALRQAAWSVVEAQGLHGQMRDATPVLTLLGTQGRMPEWCDRRKSRGHVAIPLCTSSYVDSIPMIARMLQQMGIDLGIHADTESYTAQILGAGWVGLFYVDDARSARDHLGRRIIPATDFVAEHSIRTVFGLGKAYGNGAIATLVVFNNAVIPRERVEALVPMMNLFKAATLSMVADGRVFAPEG